MPSLSKVRREREPKIVRAVKAKGFPDLGAYFRKRWGWTFERMGDELKVAAATVSDYYGLFVKDLKAGEPAKKRAK